LREDEAGLVAVKHGDSKLAFALLLRFTAGTGVSRAAGELHPDAVEFMARVVGADQAELAGYDWSGRTGYAQICEWPGTTSPGSSTLTNHAVAQVRCRARGDDVEDLQPPWAGPSLSNMRIPALSSTGTT
jgi:hypothetical protein